MRTLTEAELLNIRVDLQKHAIQPDADGWYTLNPNTEGSAMNERKWTKGPWEWRFNSTAGNWFLYGADGEMVGSMPMDKPLQTATPDLYEALEEANNVIRSLAVAYLMTIPDGDERGFFPLYDRMKSALAKARGEA